MSRAEFDCGSAKIKKTIHADLPVPASPDERNEQRRVFAFSFRLRFRLRYSCTHTEVTCVVLSLRLAWTCPWPWRAASARRAPLADHHSRHSFARLTPTPTHPASASPMHVCSLGCAARAPSTTRVVTSPARPARASHIGGASHIGVEALRYLSLCHARTTCHSCWSASGASAVSSRRASCVAYLASSVSSSAEDLP